MKVSEIMARDVVSVGRDEPVSCAARLMECLKDRHVIPLLCQVAGTGKAGRAGTDDCNFLSVGRSLCRLNTAVCAVGIRNETLQLSDGNSLALDSADADALTLSLLRTYTAAYCRKTGGLCDDAAGCRNIAVLDLTDKSRNVDVDRTSLNTARILAVKTSLRLCLCYLKLGLFFTLKLSTVTFNLSFKDVVSNLPQYI